MADSPPLYDELRIRFDPAGGKCYRTVATAADDSTASATFRVPSTELELDNFVLRVGRQRVSARSYHSKQMDEARQFGAANKIAYSNLRARLGRLRDWWTEGG
jgi:hypothetical protein